MRQPSRYTQLFAESRAGRWISERQVRAMSYHSRHGLVAVNVVTPEILREAA